MSSKLDAHKKAMAKARREQIVEQMRDGMVVRSSTFRPRKGKGSYTRKAKHKEQI